MNDLNSELAWEQNMVDFGVDRFRKQQEQAQDRGDYTGTSGGKRLLKGYLGQVSEFIAHYCAGNQPGGRRRSKFTPILAAVDPDKLALFTLTEVISAVYGESDVTAAANRIGVMVEDELRFTEFEIAKPALFAQLQRDLDQRKSENYRHRHRVLVHTMNKNEMEWKSWGTEMCVNVGALLLSLALDATDIVYKETIRQGRKSKVVLRATPEVLEWIAKSDEALAVLLPDRMPTLIPPEDWTTHLDGGYHLPRLRASTGLVKFRRGEAGHKHKRLMPEAQIAPVVSAVNGMQRTPWRINKRVLETMQAVWESNLGVGMPPSQPYEVPKSPIEIGRKDLSDQEQELLTAWKTEAREVHALEKHRQSLVLGVSRAMRIGEMLKEQEHFYYVYQLDFRGRVYAASSGVSPQGSDPSKGLLEFSTGKPLGERGLYWLKVHGANKYGEDKCSYDDRVAWVDDRRDQWAAVARDPLGFRNHWKDADKPYQFLAFCFEYAAAVEHGPTYVSRLPVALDGSCNGLQHFSAMLRDPIGGAAVNLTPSPCPSDIYQDVADVATEKLRSLVRSPAVTDAEVGARNAAINWLGLFDKLGYEGMPRKASKKPVMTLPYGSTQQACTSSLFSWYMEQQVNYFPEGTAFKHCIMMSALLWESISEVVVAARAAMDWLQDAAGTLAKDDVPLIYNSVLGLPIYQGSPNTDIKRVCHRIGGAQMRLNVMVEIDGISARKQRQGSSPNLVHNVDAAHMQMCINAGLAVGIDNFAMIHDDFGTHACHIDEWHKIIREQFIKLHTDHDILQEFKDAQETHWGSDLPDLPAKGTLDLGSVAESPYFFG